MGYAESAFLGFFIGGCIWGLIPLIVGICKKKAGIGLGLMALCGVTAFLSSILPFWVAIISGISLLFVKSPDKE